MTNANHTAGPRGPGRSAGPAAPPPTPQPALTARPAPAGLAETWRPRAVAVRALTPRMPVRARIARDIHDVLAHSLAAVSVNLQAAGGLLASDTLPADNPELAKAIECIDRAGTLTREGLAAARRAILALREDAAPLPDQLASLAGSEFLLEPVVSVGLVVERRHLAVAGRPVQGDRLGQDPVGLQPQHPDAVRRGAGLQLGQEPAAQADPAGRRVPPHPLELRRGARVELHRPP